MHILLTLKYMAGLIAFASNRPIFGIRHTVRVLNTRQHASYCIIQAQTGVVTRERPENLKMDSVTKSVFHRFPIAKNAVNIITPFARRYRSKIMTGFGAPGLICLRFANCFNHAEGNSVQRKSGYHSRMVIWTGGPLGGMFTARSR